MQVEVQIIGDKILSASDLDAMNRAEVRSRKYKYCTINTREYGDFLAEVAYSDSEEVWEPVRVMVDGEWVSIDFFDSIEEGGSYSCEDYRTHA